MLEISTRALALDLKTLLTGTVVEMEKTMQCIYGDYANPAGLGRRGAARHGTVWPRNATPRQGESTGLPTPLKGMTPPRANKSVLMAARLALALALGPRLRSARLFYSIGINVLCGGMTVLSIVHRKAAAC